MVRGWRARTEHAKEPSAVDVGGIGEHRGRGQATVRSRQARTRTKEGALKQPPSQAAPRRASRIRRRSAWGRSGRSRARGAQPLAEHGVGPFASQSSALAADRIPRYERLKAAASRTVARAVRAVKVEDDMTQLRPDSCRAAVD